MIQKNNRRYSFTSSSSRIVVFYFPHPLHRCPGTSCSSPVEHRQCTARRRQDTLWPPTRCTLLPHGRSPGTLSPDPPSAWRSPTSTATGSAPLSVPSSSPWPCSFSWPTSLVSHLRCCHRRSRAASQPPGMGWLNTACCSSLFCLYLCWMCWLFALQPFMQPWFNCRRSDRRVSHTRIYWNIAVILKLGPCCFVMEWWLVFVSFACIQCSTKWFGLSHICHK